MRDFNAAEGEMPMPTKIIITLAIIVGIGLGTGFLVAGLMILNGEPEEATFTVAGGSAILVSSIAALVAHLAGGFRDIDDREP
jgi:hypothetical protein